MLVSELIKNLQELSYEHFLITKSKVPMGCSPNEPTVEIFTIARQGEPKMTLSEDGGTIILFADSAEH